LQNEAPQKDAKDIVSPLQGALDFALSQDNEDMFVSSDLMGDPLFASDSPSSRRNTVSISKKQSQNSLKRAGSKSAKAVLDNDVLEYPSGKVERMKGRYA
jgi:hypothetical protein